MLSLCIDTSYKYLSCCLIENDKLIASYDELCFKRQSEKLFVVLEKLFQQAKRKRDEVDSICISKGPGSYTGVRIALTLAKTLAAVQKIDVYTISTLRLYAANEPKTMVIMDARAGRVYYGIYNKDKIIQEDCVDTIENIAVDGYQLVGDASLFGSQDKMPKISEAFLLCRGSWEKIEDSDYLTPTYLKESEDYHR